MCTSGAGKAIGVCVGVKAVCVRVCRGVCAWVCIGGARITAGVCVCACMWVRGSMQWLDYIADKLTHQLTCIHLNVQYNAEKH